MNIGIIGGGAIATFLLETINLQANKDMRITSLYIRDQVKYKKLQQKYNVTLYSNIDHFLQSNIDIVVEAANVQAVNKLLPTIIKKKDAIIISIGAFVDHCFLKNVYSIAEDSKKNIYLPSGAIGGLDLLQSAHALGEVSEVTLTTRKPAHTLTDDQLTVEKVIFNGSATEAIEKFPKNINVSIILSLAGIGTDDTKVTVIANPELTKNEHTIHLKGKFGEASLKVTNNPIDNNPNTSYLAALSVLGTLQKLTNRIHIG